VELRSFTLFFFKEREMFKATKVVDVSAAHCLNLPYHSKCTRPHGHNYRVAVTVQAERLNACGMVCDFSLIKKVVGRFDHSTIETTSIFDDGRPFIDHFDNATAENIALAIRAAVKKEMGDDRKMGNINADVSRVEVGETGGNIVVWEAP